MRDFFVFISIFLSQVYWNKKFFIHKYIHFVFTLSKVVHYVSLSFLY